jgi:pyruvate/2-oxoglutarate dehydrogenase complex dihydrolipoamide acyltransferase (E2) component
MKNTVNVEILPEDFGCADARVVAIHVSEGETAETGKRLVDFECDKATFEASMPGDGLIEKIHVRVGDVLSEKTTVATVSVDA